MAGQAGSQSYIELRSNRISLKALPMGGRKHPAQWGVHDRNTSLPSLGGGLVFLPMPLHKAFKPSYMSFRLWAPAPRRSLVRRCVCVSRGQYVNGWLIDLASLGVRQVYPLLGVNSKPGPMDPGFYFFPSIRGHIKQLFPLTNRPMLDY
jgi:hypothetical protein